MPGTAPHSLRQRTLPALLLGGDTLCVFAGLLAGYGLRYHTPLGAVFIDVPNARLGDYLPLLLLGTAFLVGAFAHLNLYDERLLLRRYQAMNIILKGTAFWFVAYLGVSLVLKFEPPISRLFVVFACLATLALLYLWRSAFYAVASSPALRERIQQRAAVLGWTAEAHELAAEISEHPAHPFRLLGVIEVASAGQSAPPTPPTLPRLGAVDELPELLARHGIDVLIVARLDMPRGELARLVEVCERAYVELKIIPSVFQVFVSGLRLQTVGRVPLLGIDDLALAKLFNRALKRALDLVGASVGLLLSAPVVAVLAAGIRRESPGGPVFFRQTRIGANHRPFTLYKLRSMTPDAAAQDDEAVSTGTGDARLLRLGAFMRRWNLDELPQFWNVLCGDMSLIGPRPERPHHVARLSAAIPHYLPRHLVKPGMTGWAQVNGLRGGSAIEQRIQHDIYYIENWSLWLDLQILLLTLVRWKNPAV
ncbi:MAG: sugar transferase [Opitutae bacterium]|nr:sugar transferase [Opitutae bacterium]